LRVVSRRDAAARRRAAAGRAPGAVDPELVAPLPGTVVAVHSADGDVVEAGARLVTIEAMKMEHTVTAPHAGTVRLRTAAGAQVARDAVVATVTPGVGEPHDHVGSPASAGSTPTTSVIRLTSVADAGVAAEDARIAGVTSSSAEPASAGSARTTSVIRLTSVADAGVPAEDARIAEDTPTPEASSGPATGAPARPEPHDPADIPAPAPIPSHKETLP
ncbi:biotin/lipoyl-containing protein, partial [uncultured Microbacterium sp.]|uniref:biotin/lipoyl-containing protein n=1 Tax=uncultured Microbacterium sp. TaxID=191216 RepID=UPI0028D21891